MRIIFGAAIVLVFIGAVVSAPPPPIRFEVASIRPAPPGQANADNPSFAAYRAGKATGFCMVCISGLRYDYYGAWLKVLIGEAFGVDARLVVGPAWLNQQDGTNFVIHAVMPAGATKEQLPEMLKALLEERFHLVAHLATVEQTGYALVAAKNGPKLKQARDLDRSACEPWVDSIPGTDGTPNQICRTSREEGASALNTTMSTNGVFGPTLSATSRGETRENHSEYFRITMQELAKNLAQVLSTGSPSMPDGGSVVPVADQTGIDGAWDVVVDRSLGEMALSSISASLEKQGLRLERRTVPTQKLMVDNLDKVPTEN